MTKLVLATRKSPLALAQAELVAAHLRDNLGVETELLKIVTTGDKQTKAEMKKILKEIQSGKFTKEWVKEHKGGLKNYHALLKKGEQHQIEKTGAYLRSMMPWMTKKNIKGVQASYS